jgi:hypothetical protein
MTEKKTGRDADDIRPAELPENSTDFLVAASSPESKPDAAAVHNDDGDFENSGSTTWSGENQNPPILNFEREDWSLFRTAEGLQQKAGVPAELLRRLALKELADNGLDNNAETRVGSLKGGGFYVDDAGPGLDGTPEEIAERYSIRRPMRSSKLLRKPQRGALGNGLRVVAGIVLASGGRLVVITRNRRIELRPKFDGSTAVVSVKDVDRPRGTRVLISFGPSVPDDDHNPLEWAAKAIRAARCAAGKNYSGLTSGHWYDAAQFHELILAGGTEPIRSLVAQIDGCSGGKAGEIVAAARLGRTACKDVSRTKATELLNLVRANSRPVSAERLGAVGRDFCPEGHYAVKRGTVAMGGPEPPLASIPYIVEAWAAPKEERSNDVDVVGVFVNRTPITSTVEAYRDADKDITLTGSGLHHYCSGPKKGGFNILLHITTPFMPIMSDGKAPDLSWFKQAIMDAVSAVSRKAHRSVPKDEKVTQKSIILENLDAVIAIVSGPKRQRYSERQILYKMRKIVQDETNEELTTGNFKSIITDYEAEHGEIPRMYREPRGSIYHPHIKETIPISTLTVEKYERPPWNYNKLVYNEKERLQRGAQGRWMVRASRLRADLVEGFFHAGHPRFSRQAR